MSAISNATASAASQQVAQKRPAQAAPAQQQTSAPKAAAVSDNDADDAGSKATSVYNQNGDVDTQA